MKHYYLHLTNSKFYISDQTVNAIIRMLKGIDSSIKISRGKENGWAIYFDSDIEFNIFNEAIKKFIIEKKYEYTQYKLLVMKNSKFGISENFVHIIPFEKFNIN